MNSVRGSSFIHCVSVSSRYMLRIASIVSSVITTVVFVASTKAR